MKKSLTNNLGLKLLAFFIATMLWLIVVNIDDPYTKQTYSNPNPVGNISIVEGKVYLFTYFLFECF